MPANLREDAANAAAGRVENLVLAMYPVGGAPQYQSFATRDELDTAYGAAADTPEKYDYVAAFDKNDPAWPAAWADFGPAIRTIPVMAPAPHVITQTKVNRGPLAAVGAIGGALGLGILAAKHGRKVARRARGRR